MIWAQPGMMLEVDRAITYHHIGGNRSRNPQESIIERVDATACSCRAKFKIKHFFFLRPLPIPETPFISSLSNHSFVVMKILIGTLALLIGFSNAACPNQCSGHGTCGVDEVVSRE